MFTAMLQSSAVKSDQLSGTTHVSLKYGHIVIQSQIVVGLYRCLFQTRQEYDCIDMCYIPFSDKIEM